jgi:hypothetical protein
MTSDYNPEAERALNIGEVGVGVDFVGERGTVLVANRAGRVVF